MFLSHAIVGLTFHSDALAHYVARRERAGSLSGSGNILELVANHLTLRPPVAVWLTAYGLNFYTRLFTGDPVGGVEHAYSEAC